MSEKKCKKCCKDATWKLYGKFYCELCARLELNVHCTRAPRICEMCGDPLPDDVYYMDDEDNAFCSPECAFEYNGAEKLEEEEEDDDEDK